MTGIQTMVLKNGNSWGGGPFNLYDYKDKMVGTAPKMVKVGIHWSNADADLTQLITVLYAFCFKKEPKKEEQRYLRSG